MNIIDHKTFLSLPAGVLYSKFEPFVFSDLSIKGETIGNSDFFYQDIASAVDCGCRLDDAMDGKITMDFNCAGRDGTFNSDQIFAVWEKDDVISLIERLIKSYDLSVEIFS